MEIPPARVRIIDFEAFLFLFFDVPIQRSNYLPLDVGLVRHPGARAVTCQMESDFTKPSSATGPTLPVFFTSSSCFNATVSFEPELRSWPQEVFCRLTLP